MDKNIFGSFFAQRSMYVYKKRRAPRLLKLSKAILEISVQELSRYVLPQIGLTLGDSHTNAGSGSRYKVFLLLGLGLSSLSLHTAGQGSRMSSNLSPPSLSRRLPSFWSD